MPSSAYSTGSNLTQSNPMPQPSVFLYTINYSVEVWDELSLVYQVKGHQGNTSYYLNYSVQWQTFCCTSLLKSTIVNFFITWWSHFTLVLLIIGCTSHDQYYLGKMYFKFNQIFYGICYSLPCFAFCYIAHDSGT